MNPRPVDEEIARYAPPGPPPRGVVVESDAHFTLCLAETMMQRQFAFVVVNLVGRLSDLSRQAVPHLLCAGLKRCTTL